MFGHDGPALRLAGTATTTGSHRKADLIATGAGLIVGTVIGAMTHAGPEKWETATLPRRSIAKLELGPAGASIVFFFGFGRR